MSYGLRDFDGVRIELCDECGFDEREVGPLTTAFAHVYEALQRLQRHRDAGRRPEEETWSGTESAGHCVDVADHILAICSHGAGRPESASVLSLSEAAAAAQDATGLGAMPVPRAKPRVRSTPAIGFQSNRYDPGVFGNGCSM